MLAAFRNRLRQSSVRFRFGTPVAAEYIGIVGSQVEKPKIKAKSKVEKPKKIKAKKSKVEKPKIKANF